MSFLIVVLALFILPFLLVGFGLFFKQDLGIREFSDGTFTHNYELPEWLKWLQNPEDHLTGDARGWYWNIYMKGKPDWLKMVWWSAWRNPFNYLKRVVMGLDVRDYTFHKLWGQDYVRDDLRSQGFQILYAKPKIGGLPRPMLYWVRSWGQSDRAIVFQFGWKIKLSHEGVEYDYKWDYFKGLTFEPQLFKDIS